MKKILALLLISFVLTTDSVPEEQETLDLLESNESVSNGYNRNKAVEYAHKYANGVNHKCGTGAWSCTPYGYFGSEKCGYKGEGGDCANFVSQCLIAGGHAKLAGHKEYCRNICGAEVGATELGLCLSKKFGHKRQCGYKLKPPSWVTIGDVLIYHPGNCDNYNAHAVIVTKISSGTPYITCHSSVQVDRAYTYMGDSKPYLEWIHVE